MADQSTSRTPDSTPAAPDAAPATTARFAVSPYCARLRSKKYFFLETPPMTPGDILDASGHCWCARTQQAVGPDSEIVRPDACVAARTCFESRPPLV